MLGPPLICRVAILLCLANGLVPSASEIIAVVTNREDHTLVAHWSDVFSVAVDIITASAAGKTEYTILTTEVLKSDLTIPAPIIVRQDADGFMSHVKLNWHIK